jgi:hypothetical protein
VVVEKSSAIMGRATIEAIRITENTMETTVVVLMERLANAILRQQADGDALLG